jgi:hypothetical protein
MVWSQYSHDNGDNTGQICDIQLTQDPCEAVTLLGQYG